MAGVGEDASVSQSPGAVLHGSSKPADYMALREQPRGNSAGFIRAWIAANLYAIAKTLHGRCDLLERVSGPKKWRGESAVPHLTRLRGSLDSCTQGGAIIAGGWLNIDFIEPAGLSQTAVGGAVQSHSAGHCQTPRLRKIAKVSANMQHHVIQTLLQGGGDVAVVIGNFLFGGARRHQVRFQILPGGSIILTLLASLVVSQNSDANPALRA